MNTTARYALVIPKLKKLIAISGPIAVVSFGMVRLVVPRLSPELRSNALFVLMLIFAVSAWACLGSLIVLGVCLLEGSGSRERP